MTENTRATLVEAFCVVFGREPDKVHEAEWKAWLARFARFRRFLDAEAWTDAAMCLVPDDGLHLALARHLWAEEPDKRCGYAVLTRYRRDDDGGRYFDREFVADAETPAHALLAACLKAKEQADV